MWDQPEESQTSPFFMFFHASTVMGQSEKVLFVVVPGTAKKCAKLPGASTSVVLCRNNLTPECARCEIEFTLMGRRVETSQL
jgi:hypothetical protein